MMQQVFKLACNSAIELAPCLSPGSRAMRAGGRVDAELLAAVNTVISERFGNESQTRVQRNHPGQPSVMHPGVRNGRAVSPDGRAKHQCGSSHDIVLKKSCCRAT